MGVHVHQAGQPKLPPERGDRSGLRWLWQTRIINVWRFWRFRYIWHVWHISSLPAATVAPTAEPMQTLSPVAIHR